MVKPKVGLMIFSESLAREDVYKKRKPIQNREIEKFKKEIEDAVDLVIPSNGDIRSKKDVFDSIHFFSSQIVDTLVFMIPIFVSSSLIVKAANLVSVPIVLMGNEAVDSISQLGFLVAAGSMEQVGIPYKRLPGDIKDQKVKEELLNFLRAASAYKRLRGSTYGCFGGRSLGINTGVSDLVMWQKYFGVDIEHIDQFEIVRRAETIQSEPLNLHRTWLRNNMGALCFDGKSFTPETLDKQIKSYIATKNIIAEYELDFIGVKCQPEMSNGYVLQCLNTSLQNDPYDAEGPKEPIMCSCEADSDGALTMHILKLISGGSPSSLQDILVLGNDEMVLANCGSLPTFFAATSEKDKENLKEVHMLPNTFGEAGGGTTQFVAAEGLYTFARLCRKKDKYWMGMFSTTTLKKDREELRKYIWPRPHTFVKVNFDRDIFLRTFNSNHIHHVQGDHVSELEAFCEIAGIEHTVYAR